MAANRHLVCDTSPLTTVYYSNHLFGKVSPGLVELARRPYDEVILCAPDFAFVQDGTRVDDTFRLAQDAWYRRELADRSIQWLDVEGSLQDRVGQIMSKLSAA